MVKDRSSFAVIDLGVQAPEGHCAFRKIGKHTLIEWTIRRLAESSLLDAIALTGSAALESMVEGMGIEPARWYPSEALTPLGRTIDVAAKTRAQWIVLVQDNAPFIDPVLVDRLIAAAWATPTIDVISFTSTSRPASSIQNLGVIAKICSTRALKRVAAATSMDEDERAVGRLLLSMPELFRSRCLPLPKALDREGVRWVLETEEDWERAKLLLDSSSADRDYRELADLAIHCDRNRLL
jgi:spore coat polysaccharide biosynthesis protein SpsF (cytidylyltransferase family)